MLCKTPIDMERITSEINLVYSVETDYEFDTNAGLDPALARVWSRRRNSKYPI